MKIAYIIQNLMHGGAEMQLIAVATAQARLGNEVLIVTLFEPDSSFLGELREHNISIRSFDLSGFVKLPAIVMAIRKVIIEYQADVVHSHMYHSNMIARLIFPTYRKPKYVCTAHNIREGGRLRDWAYRLTDGLCNVTTNVSQAAVDRYNRKGLVRRNRCLLVENGIDMERFQFRKQVRDKYREEFRLDECFVWLAVASLTEQKDFPNMLKAFSSIVGDERIQTHLLIAGSGRLEAMLKRIIEELNLEERVSMLGPRYDVVNLYSMADGYVMSSAWEGLPIVLLEAASSELPAVVTDVGGNSEIVLDGTSGFVVPARNSELLAERMASLMLLPEVRRKAFGAAARQHISKSYSIDNVTRKWNELYKTL